MIARSVFWLLLGSVLLLPIPFGSIFPWTYTLLAMIVAVLVAIWSITLAVAGKPPPVTLAMIGAPAILFFGVIIWAIIQAVPWTPTGWHNPVWSETAAVLDGPVQGSISVVPYATETSIMRLLTYAGIFWLALQFGRSSDRARQVFYAVAVAGLFYAAYGLIVDVTDLQTILWYDKDMYQSILTSTFRYKNAYATYAGMGLICTTVLLVRALGQEDFSHMGPRERLRNVLLQIFEHSTLLLIAFILIVPALLLSESRGGFLATIVSMIVFAITLRFAKSPSLPYRKSAVTLMVLAGVIFGAISGGSLLDRLGKTSGDEKRERIYSQTIDAISEHPLKGWGLGSYESVFAGFQDDEFVTRTMRAHNEYLDNALGLGIPAAMALVIAIMLIAWRCLRGSITRQRDGYYPAAGFAIVVLVGVHSLVDFTLQVPAVAATFALLLGTCCAQSWSSLVRRIARTGTRTG